MNKVFVMFGHILFMMRAKVGISVDFMMQKIRQSLISYTVVIKNTD